MNSKFLEIKEYNGDGYMPLVHYGEWLVAELRYADELLPENISALQKHVETDEIFILLKGNCALFIKDTDNNKIYAEKLEPLKIYNVKKSTLHSHTLSHDATVIVIENENTSDKNSFEIALSQSEKKEIVEKSRALGF